MIIKCLPIYAFDREIVLVLPELFKVFWYDLDIFSNQVEKFGFMGVDLKGEEYDDNNE